MPADLQISFNLDGQKYDVGLKKAEGVASKSNVIIGGVEYSLQGSEKGIEFIKEFFMKLPADSTRSLTLAGNELKARLWLAGAKDINLSTMEATHKIGLRTLTDNAPFDIRQTINDVCLAMKDKYVFPDIGKKCSEFLQKQLREGAYEAISDLESFAQAVTADLRLVSADKHISVMLNSPPTKPEVEKPTVPSIEEEGSFQIEDDFSRPVLTDEFQYKPSSDIGWMGRPHDSLTYEMQVGFLADKPSVGYMDLNVFGVCKERDDTVEMREDVASRRQAYIAAVDKLKDAETIIIDLRNNGGGDPFAVQLLCSLFVEEGMPLNRIEWRTEEGPKSEDFNTLSYSELPQEKRLLNKKIYVLIGPQTFSAAEEFSNNMKVLEKATFVGEPSGGGANPGGPFQISSDLTVFIPTGKAVNPIQKGNWEGEGIIPDHMVPEGRAFDVAVSLIK